MAASVSFQVMQDLAYTTLAESGAFLAKNQIRNITNVFAWDLEKQCNYVILKFGPTEKSRPA